MRSIFLIIIFILASKSLHAQTDSINNITYHNEQIKASSVLDYKHSEEWKTYKKLNIAGWSSLGIGIPTTLYGIVGLGLSDSALSDGGGNGGIFIAVTAVGGALALSSIPLLIIAHNYKNKTKTSNLGIGLTNLNTHYYTVHNINTPALRFTYSF